jgi:MFS family permease
MNFQIARVYAFSFFDAFILVYGLYTLLFVQSGVSPAGVGLLLGVWSTTAFVLEIPTGIIADKYSRRHILFFAQVVRALGYAVWLLFPNFLGFLVGFILWGVKSAFTSGAFQGLVYDHLKDEGREADYARVIGRTKAASYAGITAAALAASLAVHFGGYRLVLAVSVVAGLIAGAVIITFNPPRSHTVEATVHPIEILKTGVKVIWSDGLALTLVIFVGIVHGFGGAIDEYFPIFGSLAPIPLATIPLFMALLSATQAMVAMFVHRFEKAPLVWLYMLFTLMGAVMVTASLILGLGALALLCVFNGIYGIVSTTVEVRIQHRIPSAVRATATSVQGLVVEIAVLAVYFGFGLVAQIASYDRAFLGFGLAIIAIGILYLAVRLARPKAIAEVG